VVGNGQQSSHRGFNYRSFDLFYRMVLGGPHGIMSVIIYRLFNEDSLLKERMNI